MKLTQRDIQYIMDEAMSMVNENVAVDSVSAATKSEADVQINNAKSAIENGKKIAKAGRGAVRALAKSGKKLAKAGAKVGMKAVHALSNVGKNIAKNGSEALNGENKANIQQQNKNVNEGAKFRLTKRDIQYIMNETRNIVAEKRGMMNKESRPTQKKK